MFLLECLMAFWEIVIGSFMMLWSLYLLLRRDVILSSEHARMGGGLRSYFTGKGISNAHGGNFRVSEGGVIDSINEDGKPVMRGTRRILP